MSFWNSKPPQHMLRCNRKGEARNDELNANRIGSQKVSGRWPKKKTARLLTTPRRRWRLWTDDG